MSQRCQTRTHAPQQTTCTNRSDLLNHLVGAGEGSSRAHRAPLIDTTPHGATRMAVHATVDTTRSHAGAPVRDGLRLINA